MIIAIFTVIWYIAYIYLNFESNFVIISIAIPCALITYNLFKNHGWKYLMYAIMLVFIGFVIMEFVIGCTGVILSIHSLRYPNYEELSLGDGILFIAFFIYCFWGSVIGLVSAITKTLIRKQCKKDSD